LDFGFWILDFGLRWDYTVPKYISCRNGLRENSQLIPINKDYNSFMEANFQEENYGKTNAIVMGH
jgi:hypothetical protein